MIKKPVAETGSQVIVPVEVSISSGGVSREGKGEENESM